MSSSSFMKKIFSNSDITRIRIGIPEGHKHIRTIIETGNGEKLIFQEATIANIVRAYTIIKTHPQKRALELEQKQPSDKKEGYAEYQLIETDNDEGIIKKELADAYNECY